MFCLPPAGDEIYGPVGVGKHYDYLEFNMQPADTAWVYCYKDGRLSALYNVRYLESIHFDDAEVLEG
jgi:hypothetical protein